MDTTKENFQNLESDIQNRICLQFCKGLGIGKGKITDLKRVLNLANPILNLSFENGKLKSLNIDKESIKATSLLIRTYL